jgi:hypothetical protein
MLSKSTMMLFAEGTIAATDAIRSPSLRVTGLPAISIESSGHQ